MIRRFFIETWGCQMNERDSLRMASSLMEQGWIPARAPEDADLVLLNSCTVRERAKHKVASRIGALRKLKRQNPGLKIGLCGCVAQQEGERALSELPGLDLVLGPARLGELRELVQRMEQGERVVATGFPTQRRHEADLLARDGAAKGLVTAIEGCNQKCTFCIVPATRGPERCRPLEEVLKEVEALVAWGFGEIELLGQTVNHWRDPLRPELDFADLLEAVASVPGVRRLRFVTSYPRDFTPRMVDCFRRLPNLADSLHLPVQSGSDRILRRMGRLYTVKEYLDLVRALRDARPELVLATDIIVGFPGETEEDFEATLKLVENVRFGALYAFCFSPRPGTAATKLPDPLPGSVAAERLQRLLERQEEIQRELQEALVGKVLEVVVTEPADSEGMETGRSSCGRKVHYPVGPGEASPVGRFRRVQVERSLAHSLLGRPVGLPFGSVPGAGATELGPLRFEEKRRTGSDFSPSSRLRVIS